MKVEEEIVRIGWGTRMNRAQQKLVNSLNRARKYNASGKWGGVLARIIKLKNRLIYSCDIGITAVIPNDCVFHHSALGVVIGNNVTMGNRCQIYSNVCIGVKGRSHNDGDPKIGNDVMIGTGAIILGNISIGNGAVIAAGSVVLSSVPDYVMVAGNPATEKKSVNN